LVDTTSIVNVLFSNSGLTQLSFGGVLGYVIGWGFKKLIRILFVIIGATLAIVGAVLVYLNTEGVITINYNQLESLIISNGQWLLGVVESGLQSSQSAMGSLSLLSGLAFGFLYGFKRG